MKRVFSNYAKLLKKGFFNKSILISLLMISIEMFINQYIEEGYIRSTIMFSLIMILFIVFISEVSQKKYALITILPIKTKEYIC